MQTSFVCSHCHHDKASHWLGGWKTFYTCINCGFQWEEPQKVSVENYKCDVLNVEMKQSNLGLEA